MCRWTIKRCSQKQIILIGWSQVLFKLVTVFESEPQADVVLCLLTFSDLPGSMTRAELQMTMRLDDALRHVSHSSVNVVECSARDGGAGLAEIGQWIQHHVLPVSTLWSAIQGCLLGWYRARALHRYEYHEMCRHLTLVWVSDSRPERSRRNGHYFKLHPHRVMSRAWR